MLLERCAACRAKLHWEFVAVYGGQDAEAYLPDSSFHYAICKCGYEFQKNGAELTAEQDANGTN